MLINNILNRPPRALAAYDGRRTHIKPLGAERAAAECPRQGAEITQPQQPRPAAAYIRVSTEEQGRGHFPDWQRQAITRYAADHSVELVEEYIDFETGRLADKRPDCQRPIEHAMEHRFEVVLVFNTSRFARNFSEFWEVEAAPTERRRLPLRLFEQVWEDAGQIPRGQAPRPPGTLLPSSRGNRPNHTELNGLQSGSDGTRTRDLCRDRAAL
jgi:hypothetical protein